MANAALISLKGTIECLLNSPDIWLVPPSRHFLESAYKQLESLQEIAKRGIWSKTIRWALDGEIKVAASQLRDVIESHFSNPIYSQFESRGDGIPFSIDLRDLKQHIQSFVDTIMEIEEYLRVLYYSLAEEEEEDDDDDAVTSKIGSGGHKSKIVGLSHSYIEFKGRLIDPVNPYTIFSLIGMAGIGKTTLAKEIFEAPETAEHFDCHAWVTVGRKYQLKEIPRCILAQVDPDSDEMLAEGDEDIARCLKESLEGKRCLIVLDDVWDGYVWHHLKNYLPDQKNGSRFLVTTRLRNLNLYDEGFINMSLVMSLLNKEESWDLFREKVFGDELCPPNLVNAGKKIANNCEGLPLTIVTVADLLSKAEKTPQYWSEVAEQKNHQIFMATYNEISKVLLRSYKHLPRLLQLYFLYMGVFPQNYEIPRSKLINMWNVDEFPELNIHKFPYPNGMECLSELDSNSIVMTYQGTTSLTSPQGPPQIKTCGLHSSLWHLCSRIARKIKFSHVLNSRSDGLGEDIKRQRRLSFHNNILFGIKDVYKSVEDNCATSAHALLFYGPYHPYQVPICFCLRSLKELDALTIRFYEFPMEVLQLVQLRYLALTLNGKLPASISQLSDLQFLIVSRHLSIRSYIDPSYLPMEIWHMKKLKHLQVTGSNLPDPHGIFLESLLTLLDVSTHSCIEGVLKVIPNLEKLRIQIELMPSDDGGPLRLFDHISHLKKLRSLKCVVVNPEIVSPLAPLLIFPSYLKKLSLSGLGYPWKEMSKITSLEFLQVLKLRNYAFRGPQWEVEKEFDSLRSLVIEDTDLVEWKIGYANFESLRSLSLKRCYKLKKIYGEFESFGGKIEVVDCNPLGVEEMKQAVSTGIEVCVHSSWDDGKLKT